MTIYKNTTFLFSIVNHEKNFKYKKGIVLNLPNYLETQRKF